MREKSLLHEEHTYTQTVLVSALGSDFYLRGRVVSIGIVIKGLQIISVLPTLAPKSAEIVRDN